MNGTVTARVHADALVVGMELYDDLCDEWLPVVRVDQDRDDGLVHIEVLLTDPDRIEGNDGAERMTWAECSPDMEYIVRRRRIEDQLAAWTNR